LRSGDPEPVLIRVSPCQMITRTGNIKTVGVEIPAVEIKHGWTRISTDENSSRRTHG
jgi:hypothetical protein